MFGGSNPGDLMSAMKQMGIDVDEIDAEEVIIKTSEKDLIFEDAEVVAMEAQGERVFQVIGEPKEQGKSDKKEQAKIDKGDIELVAEKAGVEEGEAKKALEQNNGDLAEAIDSLS